ncbi:MAG: FHA domain-containing protein [Myxococcales bacterium]|nr:FHA domain-containing protein [Myxococcales bacterium]
MPAPGPRYVVAVEAGPAQGQRFRLPASGAVVGRSRGAILFPDDPFISPHHATLVVKEGKLFVRDESSTSGVFVGIQAQVTIPVEGEFAVGLRRFRFDGPLDPTPAQGRVAMYGAPLPASQLHYRIEELLVGGRPGRAIVSSSSIITVGQGRCDLSFPGDEALAPRHCELSPLPTGLMIRDLSGGLGTFVRITPGVERPLKLGDRLRIGQQVLAVEAG